MNEYDHDADEKGPEEGYDMAAARARQRRINATERAEEAYTRAYLSAVDLVEEINELLGDVTAPSETCNQVVIEPGGHTFTQVTQPTAVQARAIELLNLRP